jgi:uncharacterized membrane protein (DUF4010 family)
VNLDLGRDLTATLIGLATALGIGLMIGLERERRKGGGPQRGPAGIRTFALTSLLGGVSMALALPGLFVAATVCVGLLAAIAYARARAQDPGLTTEVALVVTFLLGGLALHQPALASGIAVLVTILLGTRERLHRFARNVLSERELHDAMLFAAAALVVMPLTPEHAVDPFGVLVPRKVWTLVVLVMAVSAAGYVSVRTLGARAGLPLSGFAGGFVSSAATIASLGARAQETPALRRAAVSGAVLSTVATIVQLVLVVGAVDTRVLRELAPALALAGAASAAYGAAFAIRGTRVPKETRADPGRAFDLRAALLFAIVISGLLLLAAFAQSRLGGGGVLLAAGLAGFADAHAAAISVASLASAGQVAPEAAVLPVLTGFTTNTVTKMVAAATAGGRTFALQTIPGLLLVLAGAWLGATLF